MRGLFCRECETLVSNHCKIFVLALQPVSNIHLVAIWELELLIYKAVILEELVETTLSNVLNHILVQVCCFLCTNCLLNLYSLVCIFARKPTLVNIRLNVFFAIN